MKTNCWFRPRSAGFRGFVARALLGFFLSLTVAARGSAQCANGQIWVPPVEVWVPAQVIVHPATTVIIPATTIWIDAQTVWIDAQTVWVAAQTVWIDAQTVWVDAQTIWIGEQWVWNEEIQDYDYVPGHEETIPGYEQTIPGYEQTIPGYEQTIPGYEQTTPGYEQTVPAREETVPEWTETIPGRTETTPGYCRDIAWTSMEEITANHGAPWLPEPETIQSGQPFVQSRLISSTRRTWERSELGDERNFTETEFDVQVCYQPAVGTGLPPPPPPPLPGGGGGGTPPTGYTLTVIGGTGGGTGLAAGTVRNITPATPPGHYFAGWTISGSGILETWQMIANGRVVMGGGDAVVEADFVPVTPGQSFWIDINNDGFPDEIFLRGVGGFTYVFENFSAIVDPELAPTFNWNPFNSWLNGLYPWNFRPDGGRQFNNPDGWPPIWSTRPDFGANVTVICDVTCTFPQVGGERYGIIWENQNGNWQAVWDVTVPGSGGGFTHTDQVTASIGRYLLVRFGKAGDIVPLIPGNPQTWPQPFKNLYYSTAFDWDDIGLDVVLNADFINAANGGTLTPSQAERLLIPVFTFGPAVPELLRRVFEQGPDRVGQVVAAIRTALIGVLASEVVSEMIAKIIAKRRNVPTSFVVYEMANTQTGEYYVGRTSGPGDHESVLRRRFSSHQRTDDPDLRKSVSQGWTNIVFNSYHDMSNWDSGAYAAMRGREQSVIDSYHAYFPGRTLANIDRGVRVDNIFARIYHNTSSFYFFPEIHIYTGNQSAVPGVVPILEYIIASDWMPTNHGSRFR